MCSLSSLAGVVAAGEQEASTPAVNEASAQPAEEEELALSRVAEGRVTKEQSLGGAGELCKQGTVTVEISHFREEE